MNCTFFKNYVQIRLTLTCMDGYLRKLLLLQILIIIPQLYFTTLFKAHNKNLLCTISHRFLEMRSFYKHRQSVLPELNHLLLFYFRCPTLLWLPSSPSLFPWRMLLQSVNLLCSGQHFKYIFFQCVPYNCLSRVQHCAALPGNLGGILLRLS